MKKWLFALLLLSPMGLEAAPASDAQVQQYADQRVRPRAEQVRALYLAMKDDKAVIDDVYSNVVLSTSTFADSRTDAPPHLLTRTDILAYNTFLDMFIAFIEGTLTDQNKNTGSEQYPIIQDACVRPARLEP